MIGEPGSPRIILDHAVPRKILIPFHGGRITWAQATAKRLNRKAEDSEPYLAILEENWYDSVDSLKRLGRVGLGVVDEGSSSRHCKAVFQG